jgi:hypothetical protein
VILHLLRAILIQPWTPPISLELGKELPQKVQEKDEAQVLLQHREHSLLVCES